MNQINEHLLSRYPLLKSLAVRNLRDASAAEKLPPFVGLVLAVMESPPAHPICFVLPKRGETARVALALHALSRVRQNHQQFIESLAHQKFRKGQPVCIHPSKEVFIYEGVRSEDPDHFWLSEMDLDRNTGPHRVKFPMKMNFPLWAVQRLEPTNAKRPRGDIRKRARELQDPQSCAIDALLGTKTFGNLSCVKNVGVLLDAQGEFSAFTESAAFQPAPSSTGTTTLQEILTFGWLAVPSQNEPGWLHSDRGGEPLIAITHSPELLANYCIDAPARSKLVVINGLSRFRNNRQAYDDMAETQSLVLFADSSEEEMIESLGSAPRPCRFWWLTAAEIQTHAQVRANGSGGMMRNVARWAANQQQLKMEPEICKNTQLETAWLLLEKLNAAVRAAEDGPLTKLAGRAWRMLNDACTVIRSLNEDEQARAIERITGFRQELERYEAWLSPEQVQSLSQAADAIEESFTPQAKLGVEKDAALYHAVAKALESGSKCALIARNETQVAELRSWLLNNGFGADAEAYSVRTLPEEAALDGLICISWPGAESMKQLAASLVAPSIKVIAYPFERRWLQLSRQRLQRRPQAPLVSSAEKTSFISKSSGVSWPDENTTENAPPARVADLDIWALEHRLRSVRKGSAPAATFAADTLAARYVSFVGETYAFLTESHSVVVATDLVSGLLRPNQRLPERVVTELRSGDFVVFPESGDREFIQEKADQLLGAQAVGLRRIAHMWKDALWASGLRPDNFLDEARSVGRPRHIATIRNWFADTSQIGPGNGNEELLADLELIALVTNHLPLQKQMSAVASAIRELRGAHMSAGMRVRDALFQKLPEVIGKVDENETKVDLGELGSAWVVELESIAADVEQRAPTEVNRLLWEDPQILLLG